MNLKFLILYPLMCVDASATLSESLHSLVPGAQIESKVLPDVLDSDFCSDIKRRESTLLLVICDDRSLLRLGSKVDQLRSILSQTSLVVIHSQASTEIRGEAVPKGAAGSFTPLQQGEGIRRVKIAQCIRPLPALPQRNFVYEWQVSTELIGRSPSFRVILDKIPAAANSPLPVLIMGETGTGKEVVAKAIHRLSPLQGGPFCVLDCASLSSGLLENELFGHERGAFTDAHRDQKGIIAKAERGTLFIDEINTLDRHFQAKFLRIIQEHEYRSLGSSDLTKGSFRTVVATNADLPFDIKTDAFRSDLFYRISTLKFVLPPLRQRREDIPELARHFLKGLRTEGPIPALSEDALSRLLAYDWPGNIRELKNVIQQACIYAKGREIQAADLELPGGETAEIQPFKVAKNRIITEFEIGYFKEVLSRSNWNVSQAARFANMNRRAFNFKKHALGLSRPTPGESEG